MSERSVHANLARAINNPTTTSINNLKNLQRRFKESGLNVNGSYVQKIENMIKILKNPYSTTKNRSLSVLRNNRPQKLPRLNLPSNLPKLNKLELYLRNTDPSTIKVNVSGEYDENLNQNTKKFKLTYLINDKNAGNATIKVLVKNGDVYFAGGRTNKDFRGRGVGTALRALLTKAALKAGYKKIMHTGVNMEHRSKFRPVGNKNIATSTWIVTKELGFTPTPEGYSVFTKNHNQSKINNVLRRSGLTI